MDKAAPQTAEGQLPYLYWERLQERPLMRRFLSDADAPQGVFKLATLIRTDRTVGRSHLPLVRRTKLLR